MHYVIGEAVEVPNSSGTHPPNTPAPEGACDCHMHIFDPRFPFVPGRSPRIGTVNDYLLLRKRMGLSRCIVVAASSYGYDNSCLLDALKRFGETARGVASINSEFSREKLVTLHEAGVRGIRVNFRVNVGPITGITSDDIVGLADKIAPFNWHLQLHMPADDIVTNESLLHDLPVTLVIDHMGRAPQPDGHLHAVAGTLERLLRAGGTYVKLSSFYETKRVRLADYGPLAIHLASIAPDRLLWGSDWNHQKDIKVDDARVFDQLAIWVPDETVRNKILVSNPDALYWRD